MKYLLIDKYPDLFWCDPDIYPVAHAGQEQQHDLEKFPDIRANQAEFSTIIKHLDLLDRPDYSDRGKLLIYKEYKLLHYGLKIVGGWSPYGYNLYIGEGRNILPVL